MENDPLAKKWCCLTCHSTNRIGKFRTRPDSPTLHCPVCGSDHIHPADGSTVDVSDYQGPIGTVN